MIKKYLFPWITILAFGLSSCVLHSKITKSGDFQEDKKVSSLHLVVIGDKDTKGAMSYLNQFLSDSLVENNIKTTKTYYCCRDKDTDLKSLLPKLLPPNYTPDHILMVVIAKVVVGYGATSSREIQLDLYNASLQKHTWTGRVRVSMSWFISDQNYRSVARSLTKAIMHELKMKKIV